MDPSIAVVTNEASSYCRLTSPKDTAYYLSHGIRRTTNDNVAFVPQTMAMSSHKRQCLFRLCQRFAPLALGSCADDYV